MVDISIETPEQTDRRLRAVVRNAELRVLDGSFQFSEFALSDLPHAIRTDALALVRDEASWSQLVPHSGDGGEAFGLISFHFPSGEDNSGFVGWLASHLKKRFGTGVFVICGYSASRGGVYDYWGYPAALADDIVAEVRRMKGQTAG